MNKQKAIDWLFRFGIYRGIRTNPPRDLIKTAIIYNGGNVTRYSIEINSTHTMNEWLNKCEGPWTIRMEKPYREQKTYVAFARKTDAAMFRIMTA